MFRQEFFILMPDLSSHRILEKKYRKLGSNRLCGFAEIQLVQTRIFHETVDGGVPHEILEDYEFIGG